MSTEDFGPAGETLDDFAAGLGIRDAVYAAAQKRVLAWQIEEARKARRITKSDMAAAMKTSRSQLDRILDPSNADVSLASLERAARAVGKMLRIDLVDA